MAEKKSKKWQELFIDATECESIYDFRSLLQYLLDCGINRNLFTFQITSSLEAIYISNYHDLARTQYNLSNVKELDGVKVIVTDKIDKKNVRKALHKMFDLWNTTGYRLDHDDWVEFEKELGL